jgi:hypothetical protein
MLAMTRTGPVVAVIITRTIKIIINASILLDEELSELVDDDRLLAILSSPQAY